LDTTVADRETGDVAVGDLVGAVGTRGVKRDPEGAAMRHNEHAAVGM
jgi:hypothetical protein